MISPWPIPKLAAVMTALFAVAALSAGQDAGVSAPKKPYTRNGSEVTLSGTMSLTGKRPQPRRIETSSDPDCTLASPKLATDWVEGNQGKLANVFVYVKSAALDGYTFEMPDSAAILEHKGCRYVPHALGLRVGQQLVVINSDQTTHNSHRYSKINPQWNQSQPAGGDPITSSFKHSEFFIPFKCNQHPWEKAYVGVFDHPFFAITDADGNYLIEGLPPGQYTVVAWHELLGEKTLDRTFVTGELSDASFTFDAEQDVRIPR